MPAEVALTSVPAERHPLISAQRKIGILLATPAAILLLSLVIGPTALVALLSLTDYQLGMAGFRYVGLNNYSAMLSDADFHRSMVQTAIYAAIVVPLSFALGLLAALLIEARLRLKTWGIGPSTSCRWQGRWSRWRPLGKSSCIPASAS